MQLAVFFPQCLQSTEALRDLLGHVFSACANGCEEDGAGVALGLHVERDAEHVADAAQRPYRVWAQGSETDLCNGIGGGLFFCGGA